jgi:hypothetical protein
MRGKYLFRRWKRRLIFLAQHLSVRHIHGPRSISYSNEELIVLSIIRNGETYVQSFIDHHFHLGVKHIVLLDNGSTDRTISIARAYPNVTILQCLRSYRNYEKLMKEYLLRRFSKGRWNVFVDIDELFDYPFSKKLSIQGLIRYLNLHSYTAVVCQMLDLFSDDELEAQGNKSNQDLKSKFRFYDISMVEKTDYIWGTPSNHSIKMHWGGIRKQLFGSQNGLTKAAMTFIDDKIELCVDWHHVRKARIADFSAVLYHFPFTYNFREKVEEAFKTGRYRSAETEYGLYWKRMQNEPALKISTAQATLLNHLDDLIDAGFLVISSEYNHYALYHG